jgi:hypothetical protein
MPLASAGWSFRTALPARGNAIGEICVPDHGEIRIQVRHQGIDMKTYAIGIALFASLLFPAGTAAQDDRRDVATVVGIYFEQAPGVLADERLVRGRGGQRWAEVRRAGTGAKTDTELVRIPPSVTLRAGDRVLVAGRGEASASAGAGAPSRVPLDPMLERPMDLSGLRSPVTRPLAVVPGSCVPF